ncbi:MAG: LPS export ABC transporter periplasmic protein LptC [Thermodesulfovibrionales bacterium]|nr:LPS export ABC transporter periplasmic protein LptC [Thermodesulfovibrionales bacterium]
MRKFLLIGLSVLFFSSLFFMLRSGKEMVGDIRTRTDSFLEDIRIVQKKDGVTTWTLTASKADFREGEQRAELSDIELRIEKNGMILHADRGVYDLSSQSFSTDETVKVSGKDIRVSADSLDYDVASGKIRTDGKIRVEGKGFSIEGTGMQADSEQKVNVLNDVKATFHK